MGKHDDIREKLIKKIDEARDRQTREDMHKLFDTARDYADFNGGRVEDVYERLEYVRQFIQDRRIRDGICSGRI